jgi:serine/threonine protein kinase
MVGTVGYLDPEYMMTARLTEKSDVYSFGVVLLVILSAQPPLYLIRPEEQEGILSRWALRCKEEGNLDQIVDPYLMGRINLWSLNKFVEIALKCVAPKGIDRPSMGDVISDLEHALQWQERADASECAKILPSRRAASSGLQKWRPRQTTLISHSLLIVVHLIEFTVAKLMGWQ